MLSFDEIGGAAAMTEWAPDQTEFYKLYARLIPIEQQRDGCLRD